MLVGWARLLSAERIIFRVSWVGVSMPPRTFPRTSLLVYSLVRPAT